MMKNYMKVSPCDCDGLLTTTESVLYRKWKVALFFSWAIFTVYEVLLSVQSIVFLEPLCNKRILPNEEGSFPSFASVIALCGFFFISIILLMKIAQARPGNERIPSIVAFNIVLMGLLSTLFFGVFHWNGVCIDVLGVSTSAMMWGEWLGNCPMLAFMVIALADKKELSKKDRTIMASFFVCILCGFLPIIPQPQFLGYFWITVSVIASIPIFFLPWYVWSIEETDPVQATDIEVGAVRGSCHQVLIRKKTQKPQFYLVLWLAIVSPLFPLTYFLAAMKIIGPGDSVGVFLLLTLLLKAFFSIGVADIHTHAFLDTLRELDKDRQVNLNDLEKERYANESRRAFLKYLFHEVRTPLNSLTMGIELLRSQQELNETDTEVLAMMTGAAQFMEETLNDVLSMQKIEEGKMELVFAQFDISASITKILSALSGPAMAKALQIEKYIAAEVPHLLIGDVYRVEHVISNLLSNAIKFSEQDDTIQVKVSKKTIQDDSEPTPTSISIVVSICDEGPGISAEDQSKLFTGFFQVRPDQLQQGKGSGLGLALCKQIVTLHGGTIGVDSVEGRGSTFHFTIPFGIIPSIVISGDEENQREQTAPSSSPINISTITIDSKATGRYGTATASDVPELLFSVLVVDDVSSNRKMLRALLNRNGAKKVDLAENGLQAVQAALADPGKYDLIFMDNLMPVMNGVEAVRKLREGGYANLVVGVTGNVLDDDVVNYLTAGVDMVMSKPVKVALLRMLLLHVHEHGAASRPGMELSEKHNGVELTWREKKF